MLLSISIRNVIRNLKRLSPLMASLLLIFFLLVMGNAVLKTTVDSLYDLYAGHVCGDLTVSAQADNNFTVFGSDQLLVGQYLIPPTLIDFADLSKMVRERPEVRSIAGLVSAVAQVELEGSKDQATVLGVDFERYFDVLSSLELLRGSLPESGRPGMLVQAGKWEDPIGKRALLASSTGGSFTLRELPVTGVFRYPVREKALNSVVLTDADTARALNGYLYGSSSEESLSEEEQGALESEFDSLFGTEDSSSNGGGGDASQEGAEDAGIDPGALFGSGENGDEASSSAAAKQKSAAAQTGGGAWNFLLVDLEERNGFEKLRQALAAEGIGRENGYLVRPWSASVGGNAQLARYLQLMFNIGLLFVAFGAVIIAANALLLSVLERTGELGTLRAVGATKGRISLMIFIETLIVVFFSALLGILLGTAAVRGLNSLGIVIDNQYIRLLFGGEPLRGEMSFAIAGAHLAAAFLLTILSVLYPLKRALAIAPVEAMRA